mmetsp:Transcript_73147/g.169636  ORF Transcript_73147/g.169636 Transcript_73147/m.169636 type:complete len:713 (+) Transcript_73147:91-2229(+)
MGGPHEFHELLSAELAAVRDRLLAKHEECLKDFSQEHLTREGGSTRDLTRAATKQKVSFDPPVRSGDSSSRSRLRGESGVFASENDAMGEVRNLKDMIVQLRSRLCLTNLGLVAPHTTTYGARDVTTDDDLAQNPECVLWREWETNLADEDNLDAEKNWVSRNFTHMTYEVDSQAREVRVPRTVINPDSNRRLMWEIAGIMLLVYDIVFIPLLQAFPIEEYPFFEAMNLLTFSYWSLDMAANFRLAFHARDGTLVVKTRKIARRYLRSWFPFDFVVIIVDLFTIFQVGSSDVMKIGTLFRTLRFLRFIRLLRLAKLKRMMSQIRMRIDSQYVFLVVNIVQHVTFLLVANHFVACAWYWLGAFLMSSMDTWVSTDFRDVSVPYKYMTALHWSLTQFTPASMSVQPVNMSERTFAVFVLVCALVIFSSFLSSITASITALRQLDARHEGQFWLLRKYLRQNHITPDLGARVTRYLQLAVSRQRLRVQEQQVDLLALLSEPLRMSLRKELFKQHCTHPFFEEIFTHGAVAMSKLCVAALDQELFSKGDVLFHEREVARRMFMVIEGRLIYLCNEVKRTPDILEPGDWCSEAALWLRWAHRWDMCAFSEATLFGINAESFRQTLTQTPADAVLPRRYAHKFLGCFSKLVEVGEASDIRPSREDVERFYKSTWTAEKDPASSWGCCSEEVRDEISVVEPATSSVSRWKLQIGASKAL